MAHLQVVPGESARAIPLGLTTRTQEERSPPPRVSDRRSF